MSISPTMKEGHEAAINGNESPGSRSATQVPPSRPKPSPSINEAVIDRYHPKDPATGDIVPDNIVSRLSVAVGAARLAAEKAQRVAEAIMANEFWTVAARHKAVQDKCHRITEPVLSTLDNALAACRKEIETLTTKTAGPPRPQDAAGYFLASEVRQRLASLSNEDREAAFAQALADEDEAALGAVLVGSPMLSGITKARQQMLRAAWQKQRFAPELARIERLQKALTDTERAGTLTLNYSLSLSSAAIVARAEASDRVMREALDS